MSKTLLFVEGIDEPVEVKQRFTTVTKYIEEATAQNKRARIATDSGRIAVEPYRVKLVREVLEEGEAPAEFEDENKAADEPVPVGAGAGSPFGSER